MSKVTIDEKICKGCSLCVSVCPKKILELAADRINPKGYNPAQCTDQSNCIGCAMCATICPDSAIMVEKE